MTSKEDQSKPLSGPAPSLRVTKFLIALLIEAAAMTGISQADVIDNQFAYRNAEHLFKDQRLAALLRAACRGDVAKIAFELQEGANPNGKGEDGATPLGWTVTCEDLSGLEALLKAGADPNYYLPIRSEPSPGGGYSPTWLAAGARNPAVLRLLLKYGGDPNASVIGGSSTALKRALTQGLHGEGWENYYTLLSAGADINREQAHETIADYAATRDQFDKVFDLLGRGYTHNLERLALKTQRSNIVPSDTQALWRGKVIVTLKQRGVHFAEK